MIIGLTGLARSGKDTVADYLVRKHGFKKIVFSDLLKEEAVKRGMPTDKMTLSYLGSLLREEKGNAVLAKMVVSRINPEEDYVIVGFRSPEEVDYVRNEVMDFVLVRVDAENALRFKRRSPADPQEKEKFFSRDDYDMATKGLAKVLDMADYVIQNNGTLEELYQNVENLLERLRGGSWTTSA